MAKKRFDMRLAVGSRSGPRSNEWAIWSRKSDLYIAQRSLGGVYKYSFHPPNVCRHALTKEYISRIEKSDRRAIQWLRDPAPEEGLSRVVRVMRIGFSTDYLSTRLSNAASEKCTWIEAAPKGGSTVIDIMFTRDNKEFLEEKLSSEPENLNHKLIAYCKMESGEAFAVSSFYSTADDNPIRIKATKYDPFDMLALPVDNLKTGRPIRVTLHNNPKDYEYLKLWEFGCFRHLPLTDQAWQEMSKRYMKPGVGRD